MKPGQYAVVEDASCGYNYRIWQIAKVDNNIVSFTNGSALPKGWILYTADNISQCQRCINNAR